MHFVTLHISNSLEELQEMAWCPLSPSPRLKVLLAPISRPQCSWRRSDKVRAMQTLHWKMSLLATKLTVKKLHFISDPNCFLCSDYQLWNPTKLYYLWNHNHIELIEQWCQWGRWLQASCSYIPHNEDLQKADLLSPQTTGSPCTGSSAVRISGIGGRGECYPLSAQSVHIPG